MHINGLKHFLICLLRSEGYSYKRFSDITYLISEVLIVKYSIFESLVNLISEKLFFWRKVSYKERYWPKV